MPNDELAELSAKRMSIIQRDNDVNLAQKAKEFAQLEIARRVPKLIAVIDKLLNSEDEKVQMHAVEMLLNRLVPKVGIIQTEEAPVDTLESHDKIAQREKIQRAIEKKIEEERKSGGV